MAFILRAAASTPTTGNTPTLAVGDIWIRPTGTRAQLQSMAPDIWMEMAVDPGFVAPGGSFPQRLAKAAAAFGATNWTPAAEGIVFAYTQPIPSIVWNVNHQLVAQFVNVLVIDPARNAIMVPDIVFTDTTWCELRFAKPVTGVALIRR